MNKQSVLRKFNKLKAIILLLPALIFVFFSGICLPLMYVASVFLALYIISLTPKETIFYFMFHEFFSIYQVFFMTGVVTCILNLAVRYIIQAAKRQRKVYLKPLIISLVILVVFSFIHYQIDTSGIFEGAIVYAVMIGFYLLFAFRDQIDANNCTLAGLCGLLLSIVMGALTYIFKNYSLKIFVIDNEKLHRFRGLTYNPNYMAMLCIFLLAFCVYNLINKKDRWWNNFIGCILCIVAGLLSMSKAFLVVFGILIIYVAVYLIAKFKKKSLIVIIPLVAVMGILALCFKGFFVNLFNRFIVYDIGSGTLFSRITTGRTDIWVTYLSEITSSIPKMLFGVGLFTRNMPINTPHNTYLFFFYRLGCFGVLLLIALAYSYYECSDKLIKIRLSNIIPIFVMIVVGMEEVVVNERFFIFIVISLVMLTSSKSVERPYITEVENISFGRRKNRRQNISKNIN